MAWFGLDRAIRVNKMTRQGPVNSANCVVDIEVKVHECNEILVKSYFGKFSTKCLTPLIIRWWWYNSELSENTTPAKLCKIIKNYLLFGNDGNTGDSGEAVGHDDDDGEGQEDSPVEEAQEEAQEDAQEVGLMHIEPDSDLCVGAIYSSFSKLEEALDKYQQANFVQVSRFTIMILINALPITRQVPAGKLCTGQ